MSWVTQAREGYGELVNAIIRPPRAEYDVADLPALREIDIDALAPTDKLDQMAAKASAEAPVSPSAVGADVD